MNFKMIFLVIIFGIPAPFFAQNFFINKASDVGIDHTYGQGFAGGGVSFMDFTGDGWDDLTLATESGELLHFYKNIGGTFEKLPALVADTFEVKQIHWVDYDNDGDKDLYLACLNGPNQLFSNDGNLNLTNVTQAAGLPLDVFESYGVCWGDVDRDGWLDIYVTKRALSFPTNQAWLYRNNGDGTFSDITASSNTADPGKAAFMPAFLDFNGDLWQDIYTAHDKTKINTLLKNNGDLTFSDISESSGANVQINAMCVAVGDYDNDSDLDIYVSNTPDGNKLLRNNGDETFTELANSSGVGFFGIGWGSNFLDADNDGDLDLYVSGMSVGSDIVSSIFYENIGNGLFDEPDANFVGDTVSSFSNALGDFNDDGYMDIFVNNTAPHQSQLWANMPQNNMNNYLKIKLQGVISNRDGVGSWVKIFVNGQQQVRYTHCGIGYLGQNSDTEIFGVGTANLIDSIHVTWLTGHVDKLYDVSANQKLMIEEGSTTGGDIYVDPAIQTVALEPIDEKQETSILIFPNPANESVHLVFEKNETHFIRIRDQFGKIIFEKNEFGKQILLNIEDYSSGIYFLEINHSTVEKLVVMK